MTRYDATNATCKVLTFKEGLLSPLAHDLEIEATSFWIELDETRCEAEIDPRSLVVVSARKDGKRTDALSADQKETIRENIQKDVLHTSRHSSIRFEADRVEPTMVAGKLTLHGATRDVRVRVEARGNERVGTVELHQPDFGIKPYTAALGTLKVKPGVRIEITLPV